MKKYAVSTAISGLYLFSLFAVGTQSVKASLSLCAQKLLPSLFISVVISVYLLKSGLWRYLPFKRLFAKVFKLSDSASACALIGILCGFPTGAVCAAEMSAEGICSKKEAERICLIFSLPSPAFVISFVGEGLFESIYIGAVLYLVLFASLYFTNLILCLTENRDGDYMPEQNEEKYKTELFLPIVNAIGESAIRCIKLCAFVVFFSQMASAISFMLPYGVKTLVYPIFEISQGAVHISSLQLEAALIVSSAALSFSGLSVYGQIASAAYEKGLSLNGYFKKRILMSLISSCLMCALIFLPPVILGVLCFCILFFIFCKKELIECRKNEKSTKKFTKSTSADFRANKRKKNT